MVKLEIAGLFIICIIFIQDVSVDHGKAHFEAGQQSIFWHLTGDRCTLAFMLIVVIVTVKPEHNVMPASSLSLTFSDR